MNLTRAEIVQIVLWFIGAACVVGLGWWAAIDYDKFSCPPPSYDVDRVVKMHEEQRACEMELLSERENLRICTTILKNALE